MELKYNVTGERRKALVNAICDITGADKEYLGALSFAYRVDYFTIDRNGTVSFDDRADSEEIENLIEQLDKAGFEAETVDEIEVSGDKTDESDESVGFSIGIPIAEISDEEYSEDTLDKIRAIVRSKNTLIKKAIGTNKELETAVEDGSIWFDWFDKIPPQDKVGIYTDFFKALYRTAAAQKRVTAREKPCDNEKFAMRTFLIRLGLSGTEYKVLRKELTKNLTGNSAFRHGRPHDE